jgi:hypothetical protein
MLNIKMVSTEKIRLILSLKLMAVDLSASPREWAAAPVSLGLVLVIVENTLLLGALVAKHR